MSLIAESKNKDVKWVSIPGIFRYLIRVFKPDIYQRVFGDLIVDDSDTRNSLGFSTPQTTIEGIRTMVKK